MSAYTLTPVAQLLSIPLKSHPSVCICKHSFSQPLYRCSITGKPAVLNGKERRMGEKDCFPIDSALVCWGGEFLRSRLSWGMWTAILLITHDILKWLIIVTNYQANLPIIHLSNLLAEKINSHSQLQKIDGSSCLSLLLSLLSVLSGPWTNQWAKCNYGK